MKKAFNRVLIIIICSLWLILINGCGRINTPMPEQTNKTYTISKYNKGVYVGGWESQTKVYLKFEDKFIEVIGDYTIKENL